MNRTPLERQIETELSQPVAINTAFVKPDELKSWKDLLKPEYKGKIATYDPVKPGSGSQTSAYLYNTLGAEFVKGLYVDQNTAITGDYRQQSDWLARGVYPITIAAITFIVGSLLLKETHSHLIWKETESLEK